MQKGKDYMDYDYVFTFVFGYADTWMGLQDDDTLIHTHVLYTSMFTELLSKNYFKVKSTKYVDNMISNVTMTKTSIWLFFVPYCRQDFITLKLHLQYHMVGYFDRFGTVLILVASM